MKRHKVRFNLSRGENYMKWKVMYKDGKVEYYRPIDVQIVMSGCTLKNSRVAAQKIFTGETTKVVCAWVLCDDIQIIKEDFKTESNTRIKYNPRELPYWNLNGKNMDGENVKELYSVDFGLYVK
jgi:hypothetical protein